MGLSRSKKYNKATSQTNDIKSSLETKLSPSSLAQQASPRQWTGDKRPVPHPLQGISEGVHVFCLTGGPGGGKTTAIASVADRFRSLGFQVLIIPEVATMMHASGLHYPADHKVAMAWEASRLRIQLAVENNYMVTATTSKQSTVIICDRGTVDTKAYISDEEWNGIMTENGWNLVTLRDQRYDAVVHLVTAADGAEEFYTTANNEARRESPEEARAMDMKTREAWVGHSRFRIVGNEGSFKLKLNQTVDFLMSTLGYPGPETGTNIRRKFIVTAVGQEELKDVNVVDTVLTSTFLVSDPNVEVVVRKRTSGDEAFYSVSRATREEKSQRTNVVQQVIDEGIYATLLLEADQTLRSVTRQRKCFVWNRHYFELDFVGDSSPKAENEKKLLIVEADEDAEIEFPPFVKVEKDVTSNNGGLLRAFANGQTLADM